MRKATLAVTFTLPSGAPVEHVGNYRFRKVVRGYYIEESTSWGWFECDEKEVHAALAEHLQQKAAA